MSRTIFSWESTDPSKATKVIGLRRYYEFLSKRLYDEYEPTKIAKVGVKRNFLRRVDEWLSCFGTDENKYSAFKSLQYVFFAGKSEYEELYRCADRVNMRAWLRSQGSIKIFSPGAAVQMDAAIKQTWICPATDSLKINEFLKITGLTGHSDARADWRSLKKLKPTAALRGFISKQGIKRIVLIEDFVGSGRQFCGALEYVAEVFPGPILALPLIICEDGCKAVVALKKKLGRTNITLSPVLVVPPNCTVGPSVNVGEPPIFSSLRGAMADGYKTMKININGESFGFEKIGSLTVLYSNCPNNVPPIYHSYGSGNWKPLFPRAKRI